KTTMLTSARLAFEGGIRATECLQQWARYVVTAYEQENKEAHYDILPGSPASAARLRRLRRHSDHYRHAGSYETRCPTSHFPMDASQQRRGGYGALHCGSAHRVARVED